MYIKMYIGVEGTFNIKYSLQLFNELVSLTTNAFAFTYILLDFIKQTDFNIKEKKRQQLPSILNDV